MKKLLLLGAAVLAIGAPVAAVPAHAQMPTDVPYLTVPYTRQQVQLIIDNIPLPLTLSAHGEITKIWLKNQTIYEVIVVTGEQDRTLFGDPPFGPAFMDAYDGGACRAWSIRNITASGYSFVIFFQDRKGNQLASHTLSTCPS
jgi:hypothetical protein